MNELFGVSMTTIAIGCVIATGLILGFVAFIAVRNPVMFKMGLRNIPRRKAQTTLIIVGLMLSTLIMSAAFGTGDTITTSVTAAVYNLSGEADELITWDANKQAAPQKDQVIRIATVEDWQKQLAGDPDIEALVPFLSERLPVQDQRTRLNEASARVVAFRASDAAALGGLKDLSGKLVALEGDEAALNKELADKIDARPGDKVLAFYNDKPVELTVKAIVPNGILSGSFDTREQQGMAVDFATLSQVTGKGMNADGVFVSNRGGVKGGVDHSDAAERTLERLLEPTPYKVVAFKKDALFFAELFGNVFTTIFIVFGLFSIAAGVLLIFLIFVMLAAERKPEMGMARAVGAKRRQLVESFLAEGIGYDLGSAVVGLFAGMAVTFAMIAILKAAAGRDLGLDLTVSFTLRSVIVAFCLGVIATFLVVFASSWRASRLNITSAIRDLPEPSAVNPEAATGWGYYRAAINGIVAFGLPVGASFLLLGPIGMLVAAPLLLVGFVSPWFYLMRRSNVALPRGERTEERAPRWPWIVGLALPVVGWFLILPWYFIALGLVVFVRDRKPPRIAPWLATVGLVVAPAGLVLALLQDHRTQVSWSAGLGFAAGASGAVLIYAGLDRDSAFFFMLGVSLLFLWAAVTLRYFGANARLAFTTTSALLLGLWYIPSSVLSNVVGELNGDIEMFFLSGMVMVTAGVFIVVYNADIVLPGIAQLGSRYGRIVPAMKTAVAYPLTSRFRTGMTMAMIGLIMFSLVVMATLNTNFAAVFLNDESKGGFDVVAQINDNNRIDDFPAALVRAGVDPTRIRALGEFRIAYPSEAEVENRDHKKKDRTVPEYLRYEVIGADQGFLQNTIIPMKLRAAGYDSDRAIWDALGTRPALAVLPASLVAQPEGFGPPVNEDLLRLNALVDGFELFPLRLRDPGSGEVTTVTVIGVMKESADAFMALGTGGNGNGSGGIVAGKSVVTATFPASRGQRFYLKLQPGTDAKAYAKSVESALVQVSADSMQQLLDDQQSTQAAFLLVFQGFMGLGLIVGIAALAVVASRAVVERRQQIGMLRAIGYKRSMVALSFLLESGFIALSGIVLGLTLGLSLAWVLFASGDIGEEAKGADFVVPWMNLGIVCTIAFVASMVMTFLPARQASRVPVAEALRYE